MLESICALVGADGALLLSCHHDDVAIVTESSPSAKVGGTLRIPYDLLRHGDGLVLTDALPTRLLSSAYAHWLPSRVTQSALIFDPSDVAGDASSDSADGSVALGAESARTPAAGDGRGRVVSALLLVWCDRDQAAFGGTVATTLPVLRSLAALLLSPDSSRRRSDHAAERLAAIMRAAPCGVVFVSAHDAAAFVNREAARLLSLPEGAVPAVLLASAMQRVQERLEHRHRIELEYARVVSAHDAELCDWDWEFAGAAREVWRVSTVPVSEPTSAGRLWTLQDVTAERAMRRALAKDDAREREVIERQLEAVRSLAAGVAHDFSSILTVIGGSAKLMQDARTPAERGTELAVVRRLAKRGQVIVGQLLSFAGQQPSLPARVPLDVALRALRAPLQALVHELLDTDCALELALDAADAIVLIDESQLSLALLSLVATASTTRSSASASGASVAAEDRVADVSTSERVRSVRLPQPLIMRSARCEPTREGGESTGMDGRMRSVASWVAVRLEFPAPAIPTDADGRETGAASGQRDEQAVSTAAALLAPFGGSVRRAANSDGGHTVMILLPESQPTGPALQRTPAYGTLLGRSPARLPILVVDDDVGPRRVIRRLLEREGYDVLTADSADDAMRQVVACDGALSAVVSDYLMPGTTGMELLTQLRARWASLPVVLVSGFASEIVTEASMLQLRSHFLPKPFTRDELIGALETASLVLRSA